MADYNQKYANLSFEAAQNALNKQLNVMVRGGRSQAKINFLEQLFNKCDTKHIGKLDRRYVE